MKRARILLPILCLLLSSCGTIPTSFWYVEKSHPSDDAIMLAKIDNNSDLLLAFGQTYSVEGKNFFVNLALTEQTDKTVKVCFNKLILETNNQRYEAKTWWANKTGTLSIPDDFHGTAIDNQCLINKGEAYAKNRDGKTIYVGFKGEKGGLFEYFLLENVAHYWHDEARLIAKFNLEVDNETIFSGEIIKDLKKKSFRPLILAD